MAGLSSGNTLAAHVHPNLSESAALTCKAVDAFGQTVEKVLIKHGKKRSVKICPTHFIYTHILCILQQDHSVKIFCSRKGNHQ